MPVFGRTAYTYAWQTRHCVHFPNFQLLIQIINMQSTLAFISHRSTYKDFVRKIVDTVKRDNCVVDEFDFYPATKTMDEIVRNLNHAPIFVLLISKDALESEWVKFELSKARQLYDAGVIKEFLPFIIEEGVKLEDLPLWITRDWSLNVKIITSPKIIGQFIIEAQRKIRCYTNNAYGNLVNTFIGRSHCCPVKVPDDYYKV